MSSSSESSNESSNEDDELKSENSYNENDINNIIVTNLNMQDLTIPPPDYREVCPPTFEESFYYPEVKLKIMTEDIGEDEEENNLNTTQLGTEGHNSSLLFNISQNRSLQKGKNNKKEEEQMKADINKIKNKKLQEDKILKDTETFVKEVCDLLMRTSKMNAMIDHTKNNLKNLEKEIVNKNEKIKSIKNNEENNNKELDNLSDFLNNQFMHKMNEFEEEEEYYNEELNHLKNNIYVDIMNTRDFLFKYITFKKKEKIQK